MCTSTGSTLTRWGPSGPRLLRTIFRMSPLMAYGLRTTRPPMTFRVNSTLIKIRLLLWRESWNNLKTNLTQIGSHQISPRSRAPTDSRSLPCSTLLAHSTSMRCHSTPHTIDILIKITRLSQSITFIPCMVMLWWCILLPLSMLFLCHLNPSCMINVLS